MTAAPYILVSGAGPAGRELAGLLATEAFEVLLCPASEVLDQVRSRPPDLLLLAASLDEAAALLPRLRGQEAARDLPVVVALPEFTEAAAARVLELGADEFLLPPFTPPEVRARLAVLLRLKQDQRLLLASQEEFSRHFRETPRPLFCCDRQGEACTLNPALSRLLGYGPGEASAPHSLAALAFTPEDRERFFQVIRSPGRARVKVCLKSRDGRPTTVLLNDLTLPAAGEGLRGFEVLPVGSSSSLKKGLRGLVEHLLPSARDWLALLQLTPLLGGRYEKVRKLGQGSFGEVWLVTDTESLEPERHFVAKIPISRAANAKFRKEATVCQKLAPHPGAVRLVATVEDEGKLVLIQEYVQGRTLQEMFEGEIPRPLVERIILQLIDVVAYAHKNRIIHRDIKPNNIIIRPDGVLKLLDYGAAKILKEKDIGATIVGSRPFMAPEQIMGKSERRSDIWAIGVLMYLLYTGELPFYSEVEKILIDLILEIEPAPPRELNPEIPPALETIILKCLKKKVEERYPQAKALKADLLRHFPHYGTQTGRWPWIQ